MDETYAKMPHWLAERTDISCSAKVVYCRIADRIGGNGDCWPTGQTIAHDAGISQSSAWAAIAQLIEHGLIEKVPGKKSGPRNERVNHYKKKIPDSGTFLNSEASEFRNRKLPNSGTGSFRKSETEPTHITNPCNQPREEKPNFAELTKEAIEGIPELGPDVIAFQVYLNKPRTNWNSKEHVKLEELRTGFQRPGLDENGVALAVASFLDRCRSERVAFAALSKTMWRKAETQTEEANAF